LIFVPNETSALWRTALGNHGLCGLPEEGAHGKSPKCLGGILGDFWGGFCKGLK